MKNNLFSETIHWIYIIGFAIILCLPLLTTSPWFFPGDFGKTLLFRSIMALLICLFVFQCMQQGLQKSIQLALSTLKNNFIAYGLLAIFVVLLASTLFSQDPYFSLWGDPERSGGIINTIFYILFALLIFLTIRKEDWFKLWNTSIAAGTIICAIAIIQFYGLFSHIFIAIYQRPSSTLGNSILLGLYLLLLLFFTIHRTMQEHHPIYKLCYILATVVFLFTIIITGSRAAYLGLLAGVFYFIITYPKKLLILKISATTLVILVIGTVYYVNSGFLPPPLIANNHIMQAVYSRLSVATFLQDARFSAWNISLKAAQERPILGWGAENFSIAFDKHYDPTLPILKAESGSWWDRAHSLFFDTIIQFGLAGLVAYAFFFGAWFWQLTKIKNNNSGLHTSFIFEAHALQATLIAYLTADLFSFDSFSTYIMVFFLAGYSMHLIAISAASMPQAARRGAPLWQKGLLVLLLVSTGWFLWQENINILFINEKINTALTLATQRQCDQATAMMDTVMSEHSFLDVYARTEYINMMRNCTIFYPEKSALYADKGVTIMKEAVVIRPLSSRLWIFLGSFTTVQASQQQDANKKNELLNEAKIYLAKADALSPNRQETFIEQAKTDMISGDYQHMNISATTCTTLYPTVNDCYWLKGISQIYLGNLDQAQQDMAAAQKLAFDTTDIFALHQLISAYTYTKRYQELAATYEKIISLRPQTAQYHSSLALVYKILGEYKKARQEALKFLQLTPEAKDEVQEFLQGLPQ